MTMVRPVGRLAAVLSISPAVAAYGGDGGGRQLAPAAPPDPPAEGDDS